jgi:outer membrane protein OmpA-like peptidoglycan-associated protein
LYCVLSGLFAAIVYLVARLSLCFQCEQDPAVYVRGLRLAPNARRVLNNDLVGLPQPYDLRGQAPPANAAEYFCKSGKTPEFIWLRMSHVFAVVLLFLSYFFAMVPITVGLAGAAIALNQPQLEVTQTAREASIEIPADILFDFGSAEIRPRAESSLASAAEILRKRGVGSATIEGHTDSKGAAQYNIKLSEQRAEAARNWFLQQGRLTTTKFVIRGFGASKPVESNSRADGSDNPEGRQKNRRVVIVFDRR